MEQMQLTLERGPDSAALERLAAVLNRLAVGCDRPVDTVQWELSGNGGVIRCQFPVGRGPKAKRSVCDKIGRVLADYTLTEQEPLLLRSLFQRRFGYRDPVETDALIAETVALLDGVPEAGDGWNSRGRERRRRKLAARYAEYLEKHDKLHLEGFLRFRLGDYRSEIAETAESAIEERLMESQYQEFMSLLRSMVQWQDSQLTAVHVMHGGGHAFRLLDQDMRPLGGEPERQTAAEDQEEESLLVSRLLAVSPRKLIIHTPEPESQVVRTLIGIFGERAAVNPPGP